MQDERPQRSRQASPHLQLREPLRQGTPRSRPQPLNPRVRRQLRIVKPRPRETPQQPDELLPTQLL